MYNSLGAHVWLATPHPSTVIGYSAPIHRDWLLHTHPPWLATPHPSPVIGYSAPIHRDWLLHTHPPVIGYSTPIHRDWLLHTHPPWLATLHPSPVIGYSAPIHRDWLLCTHPLWLATLHPSTVIGYSTPKAYLCEACSSGCNIKSSKHGLGETLKEALIKHKNVNSKIHLSDGCGCTGEAII